MLTLKAPIQLHIAQGLTGNMDTFGERIRGNYNILGARYTPKDLLFLLTAPPELPEELGGMTTLVTQQNNVDVRSVTMDVVNNVVNRILLDGSEQFTYQDQVYITSVLNRLGITNLEQFMQQVRQLRSESESTVQLTKLYRSEVEKVLQRQAEGEKAPVLPMAKTAAAEDAAAVQDPRVTMSLEILQRLNTTNVYETVHSFQRNWISGENHFHNNEFRMAEQLRFSNAVSLAEIKQQVYQQPQLHLLHHLNQYETDVLLEAPRDEEAVLSQAAAAALVTAVDNTVTEVLNRPQLRQEQWVSIENAIWQTAENTISRFETYHSQYQLPAETAEPTPQAAWNYYLQELQEYQTLYQQLYPRAAEHGRVIGLPPMTRQQMIHLIRMEEGDTFQQELESHYHTTQQGAVLRELQGMPEQTVRHGDRTPQQLIFRETEPGVETETLQELRTRETADIRQETERTLETLRQLQETRRTERVLSESAGPVTLTPGEAEELAADILQTEITQLDQHSHTLLQTVQQGLQRQGESIAERPDVQAVLREVLGRPETAERVLRELHTREAARMLHSAEAAPEEDSPEAAETRELWETVLRQKHETHDREIQRLQEILGQQAEPAARAGETATEVLERFRTIREAEPVPEGRVRPVTLTPREAEELAADILQAEITQLDQHSHTLLQTVQQELQRQGESIAERPDVQAVLREVLGKPEATERVLRELHTREAVRMLHPAEAALEEETPVGVETYELRESVLKRQQETREREIQRLREILGRQEQPAAGTEATVAEALERFRTIREAEPAPETPVRPMTLTPREAEELAADILQAEITQLDQHSHTLLQTVQQELQRQGESIAERPDVQAVLREVLGKPEAAERVLRELHTRETARMLHPAEAAPEEEAPVGVETYELRESVFKRQQETREREIQRLREILGRQEQPAARTEATVAEALERFRTVREGEPAPEAPVRPVTLTPREAEEQAPDILVEEISRIDQHNRTLLQTLRQEARRRETPAPAGPDMQRTMRDALRALEEPESVLREVYTRQETTMVHPDYSPREESLLRQADPASRAVYEKILAYQRDPEGALAQGLIRAASMGSLQAELKRAAQDAPLQLEHPERPGDAEQVLLREQSEVVLEQFRNLPGQRVRQEIPKQPPRAVQFVHKPAAPDVTEELLEQLQQRTQTTVKTVTDESVTQQRTHQVDVRQVENKVVTQTTEDITELVNRTLARQMRTISDQVYRQMEKRLQSERSRRGRF